MGLLLSWCCRSHQFFSYCLGLDQCMLAFFHCTPVIRCMYSMSPVMDRSLFLHRLIGMSFGLEPTPSWLRNLSFCSVFAVAVLACCCCMLLHYHYYHCVRGSG